MNDIELAERFCNDVDKIMHSQQQTVTPAGTDLGEYNEMIELARALAGMDLRDKCGFRQKLRRRLFDRFSMFKRGQWAKDSIELNDDELEEVAGGIDEYSRNRLDE